MAALAVAVASRPVAAGSTRRLASAVRSPAPRRLRLVLGASCVPKAEDSHGEDAYFASHPLGAFGLADGVGGWSREGVDSGLFSRALLCNIHAELKRRSEGLSGLPNLPDTARAAFGAVREAEVIGSSTLLLAQLHMNMLSVLNLGDCGILAFRPILVQPRFVGGTPEPALRLLYRSSPMLHRPNFPLQLSSHDQDESTALGALDLVSVRLMKGDLVVAGTDGLFDNIRDLALKSMVLELQADHALHRDPSAFVSKLAATIARRAGDIARVPDEFAGGGKLDDIAVVVARAEDAEASVSGALLDNLSHGSARGYCTAARPASSWGGHGAAPASAWGGAVPSLAASRRARGVALGRRRCSTARAESLEGATVRYAADGGAPVEARVLRLLGRGSYASAWELETQGGARAVLKRFQPPDGATAALFGRHAAEEMRQQWARERRVGEELRLGPMAHPGYAHVAQLLSAAPVLDPSPGGDSAMLVHEHAGRALASAAPLLDFASRLAVAGQLLRAAALLRLHGVVHADINAENACVDAAGRARLIDFGNAVLLEGSRGRAVACDRMAALRSKYLHNPRFPASERYAFPLSVARLISDVERPRGLDVYTDRPYDPEMLPGNVAATPPEALRGMVQPGLSDVYGVGILLWWMLTGEETPFDIDVEGDRIVFVGWARFYALSQDELREELQAALRARLAPALRGAEPQAVDRVAAWLTALLAEAPEDRAAAAEAGPPAIDNS